MATVTKSNGTMVVVVSSDDNNRIKLFKDNKLIIAAESMPDYGKVKLPEGAVAVLKGNKIQPIGQKTYDLVSTALKEFDALPETVAKKEKFDLKMAYESAVMKKEQYETNAVKAGFFDGSVAKANEKAADEAKAAYINA